MTQVSSRFLKIAAILGASLAAGGCVVAPARPGIYVSGGWVATAPPAPRVEYYGASPYPGYVWIGGYWRWGPRGYIWAPGHWAAPRPGYRWVPRHWERGPRGWRLEGGRWDRR